MLHSSNTNNTTSGCNANPKVLLILIIYPLLHTLILIFHSPLGSPFQLLLPGVEMVACIQMWRFSDFECFKHGHCPSSVQGQLFCRDLLTI